MEKLKRYIITTDGEEEDGKKIEWNNTAFTANPAIKVKGLMFSCEEFKKLSFVDEPKMRLAAPLMIPMVAYRRGDAKASNPEDRKDYEVEFTVEEIEKMLVKLMANPENLKTFFNNEHSEEVIPAYLLEIWIVEDSEKDKSNYLYGCKVPKGSLFCVVQLTDRDYFDRLIEEDKTGLSIEGFFGMVLKLSENAKIYGDCFIQNEKGEFLFLQRLENDNIDPLSWCLAGGKVEDGETPEQGAKREAFEETGINLESLEFLDEIKNEDGTKSFYYIGKTTEEPTISNEHLAFKWLSLEDIEKAENLIFRQNERFVQLLKDRNTNLKSEKMAIIPDGEYKQGDKMLTVKNGEVVEERQCTAEEMACEKKPEEMASQEKTAEELAKEAEQNATVEKMAEDTQAGTVENKQLTKDDIVNIIFETVKPMIDEAMKAVIEETTKAEQEEEVTEGETKGTQQQFSANTTKGVEAVFSFLGSK
jgi:8-oxo-dGTP pyrophosphatase MutT (NUDIX family)